MSSITHQEEKLYSIAEYLKMEKKAVEKNEYHNGKIVAMSGGTLAHAILGNKIGSLLENNIETNRQDCVVANSDLKVYIEKANRFVYPDAVVLCENPEYYKQDKNAITNPIIIIEVLSDSTEKYDRGEKFRMYASLPSFKEYILIDQHQPIVDTLFRADAKYWKMQTT
ncbi:MAG: Uma2 family endonuclease, partial [Bacteroidota bacterium]